MHYFNYNESLKLFTEIHLEFEDVVPEKINHYKL